SPEELIASTFLLLLAGHETTVNLIGNGMLALIEHPDQLERLRADPSLIHSAVEGMLRFTNPVHFVAPPFALEAAEGGRVTIRRGEVALPLLASANRDEAQFPNADQMDVGRTPNKHVSFGFGVHYCVGAPLARMEARAALLALVQRFPKASLAVPESKLVW